MTRRYYVDKSRHMDKNTAIKAFSALAQDRRLEVFRLLVRSAPEGLAAGEIARRLTVPHNTLSSHLSILKNARLIASVRHGRSVVYSADFQGMGDLIAFLLQDCCQGRPEACAPLNGLLLNGGGDSPL